MNTVQLRSFLSAIRVPVVAIPLAATIAIAQQPHQPTSQPQQAGHAQHAQSPDHLQDLTKEIAAIRAQLAELQAMLAQGHAAGAAPKQMPMAAMGTSGAGQPQGMPAMPGSGMGSMMDMMKMMMGSEMGMGQQPASGTQAMPGMSSGSGMGGMMDMMKMMAPGMQGMQGGSAGASMGMDNMSRMMGMGSMPMGGMGSPAAMSTPTVLPGFPGASRIYHIGSTGFFLDHPEHISLTLEQRTALSQKREKALLQRADQQRRIEQAEQELWVLTGADQPDATAIEAKAREIATFQAEQRMAFIKAVGDAAATLTAEQRNQLTGLLPPQPATTQTMTNQPSGQHQSK